MRLMKKTVLAAVLSLTAAVAWAQAEVTYIKPEEFSDMPFNGRDRQQVLDQLTDHFKELAKKLPAGQTLKVEVLDVDLAGRLYPRRRAAEDIRIVRGGADWPTMHLRYTLEQNGKVLRSGDDQLSNMAYQDRISHYFSDDSLRYEKQMIDDWFQREFMPKTASSR